MRKTGQYSSLSWVDPRVELRCSPIEGTGMFASDAINEGEMVVVWGGSLFTDKEIKAGRARRRSVAEIGEGLYLAGAPDEKESPGDFMNHSCDPNVWMADEVSLVAKRTVAAGEELTADYVMWSSDPEWGMHRPCTCGSPSCRTTITGNDWKLAALHSRYAGHFSPYLNERIGKLARS